MRVAARARVHEAAHGGERVAPALRAAVRGRAGRRGGRRASGAARSSAARSPTRSCAGARRASGCGCACAARATCALPPGTTVAPPVISERGRFTGGACMVRGVGGVLSVAAARRRTLRCVYECTGSGECVKLGHLPWPRGCTRLVPPCHAMQLHRGALRIAGGAGRTALPVSGCKTPTARVGRPGPWRREPARQPVQAGERSIRCSSCAVSECSVVHRLPGRRHMHAVPHSNVG